MTIQIGSKSVTYGTSTIAGGKLSIEFADSSEFEAEPAPSDFDFIFASPPIEVVDFGEIYSGESSSLYLPDIFSFNSLRNFDIGLGAEIKIIDDPSRHPFTGRILDTEITFTASGEACEFPQAPASNNEDEFTFFTDPYVSDNRYTGTMRFSGQQQLGRINEYFSYKYDIPISPPIRTSENFFLTGVVKPLPVAKIKLNRPDLSATNNRYIFEENFLDSTTQSVDMFISIDHPYVGQSGNFGDQANVKFTLDRDGQYVLASSFAGGRSSKLLDERKRLLDKHVYIATKRGAEFLWDDSVIDDYKQEALTETLNVIGLEWMQQSQLFLELLSASSDSRSVYHHRLGIIAQEEGYSIDVRAQVVTSSERSSSSSADGVLRARSLIASALEHSVLEQLQGSDNPGLSTVKIFALNNDQNKKLFKVNASNYPTIKTQFDPNTYSSNDLALFQALVDRGETLILPQNGRVRLNEWVGLGFMRDSANLTGMIIGGGLNGGYGSFTKPVEPTYTWEQIIPQITPPVNIITPKAADPVDLASGAFVTDMTDLELGGDGVRGLAFKRSYNSKLFSQDTAHLGGGWTHNYNIYLSEHSDANSALGKRTAYDAAPLLIVAEVLRSLMQPADPTIQQWAVASLVANWAVDQILEKAITLHQGSQALTFRELPGGSFLSPPGVTAELVQLSNGQYKLIERSGTELIFNANNAIETIRDIDGNDLQFTYSGDMLSRVTDTYSRFLTFGYTNDRLTSVADSMGRTITFTQSKRNLTKVLGLEDTEWKYYYDLLYDDRPDYGFYHRLNKVANPENKLIFANTYDNLDRVISQEALRQTGTTVYNMHYDFSGIFSSEENVDGTRTTYYYDHNGRTVAVEDALGNSVKTEYDGQGQVVLQIDPLGNKTERQYDGNNNLVKVINANREETDYDYDAQHRLIRVTDALKHSSEIDYDAENHPIAVRDALNNEVKTAYRADGLPDLIINARNNATALTYDIYGQVVTGKAGTQPIVDTNYDSLGRLTSLTDQAGATTSFVYDDRGLVTERTDALGHKTTSSYNALGLLESQTDRNGDTTTLTYSVTGKLETVTYPTRPAAPGFAVNYIYDNKDRLRTMTDQHGTVTNYFDDLDRLTVQVDSNIKSVRYEYDEASNIKRIRYPDNKSVSYQYDALNRISNVRIDWLNLDAIPSYDAAGRLTGISHFNGTSTNYGYDDANRLTNLTHYKSDNQTLADYKYTLDENGNRTQATVSNEPIKPAALINQTQNQTFNTQKNRLQTAVTTEPVSLVYDDEGQMFSVTGTTTSTTYQFDAADRLVSYTTAGSTSTFAYDGSGNRLSATRNGVTKKYVYDAAGNLLVEMDENGNIEKYFIYGVGLMAMVDAQTSEVYVYHFDGTGHTVAMTDSSEQITHRYAYEPFGAIMAKEETIAQPFTYAAQVGIYTEADDVYYMRARYYDAKLRQFISEDPAGFVDGANLYAYVGGNPVNRVDPTGLFCVPCIGAAANLAIDAGISLATGQGYSWHQAGVAVLAGASGAAAAQRISQVARFAGTTRQITANAVAGGSINVVAGAANGSDDALANFAFGAAGSVIGSGVGALTTSTDNALFGVRGVATSAGKIVSAGAESAGAAFGGFFGNSPSSNVSGSSFSGGVGK